MISALLPNHYKSIYKEMSGALEERIFRVDMKAACKAILEEAIEAEFEERVIKARPYERGGLRQGQRNGFYTRSLDTVYGWINELKVPRLRKGGWEPVVFKRYGRREEALNRLIAECYWRGISTRDMSKILEALAGVQISHSVVTSITKQWDGEAKRWHNREIRGEYRYLCFDGIWIKNRSLGKTRRLVLVAYGIRRDGIREIIDYMFAQSESESNWLKFLTNLEVRGLNGDKVELITMDGCPGLWNACDMVYPLVKKQLCWAHKMRNILKYVKRDEQNAVKSGLTALFKVDIVKEAEAEKMINAWMKKWRNKQPKAVRCLEKDMDKMLIYFSCDPNHHKAIRTSNHIERQFKEYRRRMRPMEILPNLASADRALYALTQIRNEKLRDYPMNFTQKYLH